MAGQGSLFKRFITIAISSLFLVFISPDDPWSTGPMIALADPEADNESDESDKSKTTVLEFQLRQILAMSPRELRELDKLELKGTKVIIIGFSESFSTDLLDMFRYDVEWTKGLLRKMRDAKTDKERQAVLKESEKQVKKEKDKLDKELEEKRNDRGRKAARDRSNITTAQIREILKQVLIDRWSVRIKEGNLPRKIPVVE